MKLPPLPIENYSYNLSEDKIARFPATERDKAKLLVYENEKIKHHTFSDLHLILPKNSLLFFNDTKVIKARFIFKKITGASIEIVLLSPIKPISVAEALATKSNAIWECKIGNLKKWGDDIILNITIQGVSLSVKLVDRIKGIIEFNWTNKLMTFDQVIDTFGNVPLPPYLNRDLIPTDEEKYQTVFSNVAGAVAAPTAGLHFSNFTLKKLESSGIIMDYLTLHVSAGTFAPVKVSDASQHIMHQEEVIVSRKNINHLLSRTGKIIAVGTTALRTLESLYWFGASIINDDSADFIVTQFEPYSYISSLPTTKQSLEALARHMDKTGKEILIGKTSIFIFPGYKFRLCQGLITNFHQPRSTLLLLIAAFIGDNWKNVYSQALNNNYQFLSYGDSSILLP